MRRTLLALVPALACACSTADPGRDGGADGGIDAGLPQPRPDAGLHPDATVVACDNLLGGGTVTATAADGAATTVTGLGRESISGGGGIRVTTESGALVTVRLPLGRPYPLRDLTALELWIRGHNTNRPTWQNAAPVLVLEDESGARATYTPPAPLATDDGLRWAKVRAPLAGGPAFARTGEVDLQRLVAIELEADTWGAGFTLDLDGLAFVADDSRCPASCPQGCEACDPATLACTCPPETEGPGCVSCARGHHRDATGRCVPLVTSTATVWPNEASSANGDAWLIQNHDRLERLEPRVLVLNFANPADPPRAEALVEQVIAAFREGSRPRGYESGTAKPQLSYRLARPIVDLRDGAAGRPPAPADYPFENSTLTPRRAPGEAGAWSFDYAELYSPELAAHYGYPAPGGGHLDLCALAEAGEINEVWVVGSGDVPDVRFAEVLEHKRRYDAAGNRFPGLPDPCAGNGCFDEDVPHCRVSLRIGFINYNRGPGCFVHSQGHGLESLARRRATPGLSAWFLGFARFDLGEVYGLPFGDLYGVNCTGVPPEDGFGPGCVSYPRAGVAAFHHGGQSYLVEDFEPSCGNVHFPPNGRAHYDYANPGAVDSRCASFGRGGDPRPTSAADWDRYRTVAPDCGGEFLVWWMQNLPGLGTGHVDAGGAPMRAAWPYLFY